MSPAKELQHDWQKMLQAADFSRTLADRDQQHRAEVRKLLLDFLEVLDSLNRLRVRSSGAMAANLAALQRQLCEVFAHHGVRFLDILHQPFDPERHEAVERRPHPDLEPGTILEEVRAGCEWDGELLRAAQAVVVQEP